MDIIEKSIDTKMLTLMVLTGIPASGKSTFARDFVKGKIDWVIVNRDSIRNSRGDYWIPSQEAYITKLEDFAVEEALKKNLNVIVDATNLNPKSMTKWSQMAWQYKVNLVVKSFEIELSEAIKRDALRPQPVGEKTIRDFYYKYKSTKKVLIDSRLILEQNYQLPQAIIVDIDGTVALSNGRDAYDGIKMNTDLPNHPVIDILKKYDKNHIIFITGRDDKWQEVTTNWLMDNNVPCDKLFMRKTGDFRKDTIVKQEIYEEFIKDKFYINFVLEDRDQVVKMWRDLGLLTLQVYYGNF